ncbi:uncharacterized protein LOC126832855 isoform X1 [Adelges cooleyi]|uniref:uncharacterized protein LOC126832855 isoform X1 n=1 Tax=Adelges cooleyi TaxID=133065 RepID=UPI00218042C5|nr:uncharacterized protein LOC126832855 isoform X1 [Adelges cooleyi]
MSLMIAVPDHALTDNLKDQEESIERDIFVQQKINIELDISVPDDPNQSFGNLNLIDLGDARRHLTGKALNNIIARKLRKFASSYHRLSVYAWEYRIHEMCDFLGLWMSTKSAVLTTAADIHDYVICILIDIAGHVTKYRSFRGIYWQVHVDNIDNKIIKLEDQLI